MTELKTLKDLEYLPPCGHEGTDDWDVCACDNGFTSISILGKEGKYLVNSNELKQEAIKWVKEIEKNGLNINGLLVPPEAKTNKDWNKFMVDWIKHFFNLTEEDLK